MEIANRTALIELAAEATGLDTSDAHVGLGVDELSTLFAQQCEDHIQPARTQDDRDKWVALADRFWAYS